MKKLGKCIKYGNVNTRFVNYKEAGRLVVAVTVSVNRQVAKGGK